jgi:hypothetical protein
MDFKIIKGYLEDGMCWSNKETTPFVIIEDAHKGNDHVKVNYSVLFWDKNDNIFPYMKNITTTIYNEDLIPYMRDKKLKELLND